MRDSTQIGVSLSYRGKPRYFSRERLSSWTKGLALTGVLLCCAVVAFGAYVRLTAAGLGCPDWPGCYGHLTPRVAEDSITHATLATGPLDVKKAWREMIHRYAASTLGLVIVLILSLALLSRRWRLVGTRYAVALFAVVVFQGILGMLTVTQQLKPAFVTLHLLFGMTTLGLLWWLWLSMPRESKTPVRHTSSRPVNSTSDRDSRPKRFAYLLTLVGLFALGVQIALGGWTSSNYAAAACPDFPTCQGAWWPHMDYKNAFVLYHDLSINYEGGILDNATRIAIHLTHRIGAVVTTLSLVVAAVFVISRSALSSARLYAAGVLAALCLQLAIGISMVVQAFPLRLATAHTVGATLLLLATLALVRQLRAQTT
jgi:cytochrome c oxidase assembly protein subunit 15